MPPSFCRPLPPLVPRCALLGTIGMILSACVVGPDVTDAPAVDVPAYWASQGGETSPFQGLDLSRWWVRLNDPLLDDLVQDAVTGNLNVAAAKARIREARASYSQATGSLWPDLDASGSFSRTQATNPLGSGSGDVSNQFRAGFDSRWELDLFGGNRRTIEAAAYGVDAAEADLRATLLTLIGDVTQTYSEVRGAQARLDLAQRTATSQRQTASLVRATVNLGNTSPLDAARADGQASSTEAVIRDLETSVAEGIHRLSVLTGKPPASLKGRLSTVQPVPSPTFPIPTGIPADILLKRPDLRVLERQFAQSTAKIGAAEAARYPSVSLTGSISTAATDLGDLGRASTISWAFGPTLSVPLFNAGKLAAAVDIAEAQRDQSFVAYRAGVLTALEEVENAIVSLAQERARYERLDAAVRSYGDALTLSRVLYQNGNVSFLDLLDAERSLYSAEDTLLQSRIRITTSYIALNKALGGGWDGRIETSTPDVVDGYTGPRVRLPPVQPTPPSDPPS